MGKRHLSRLVAIAAVMRFTHESMTRCPKMEFVGPFCAAFVEAGYSAFLFCAWMGLKCTVIFARSVTPSLENTAQKCLEGLLLFWSFFLLYALHYKFLS